MPKTYLNSAQRSLDARHALLHIDRVDQVVHILYNT